MASSAADDKVALKALASELNHAVDSYEPAEGLDDFRGRSNIIEKAKKIAQLMMNPTDMSMHHSINMTELVAMRTFRRFNVLESIPDPGSISLENLSKATGLQESLLDRMLRLVVGTGFLDQTENYEYKHTKFSKAYTMVPGPGNFFQAIFDEYMKTMVYFDEYLLARKSFTEPDDALFNPYTYRHKQDGKPVWEIMSQFPDRLQGFQLGFASQEASVPIVGFYDFSQLDAPGSSDPEAVTLVDVGGGQGQSIAQILAAHPSLKASKMVLQDLPHPIAQARLSTILPAPVVKMEHDFFTPQPIKDAKAYYLRRISHDYSDDNNVIILSHLANAMNRASRVLIADMVMPKRVGEADLASAAMDMTVMVMGGKERTEEAFNAVFERAGLVLVKVWRASVGAGALVEAKLK